MNLLAIDPGPIESAALLFNCDQGVPSWWAKMPNDHLLTSLRAYGQLDPFDGATDIAALAIEMIASYGMPVGAEVFESCVWIGRFLEAWGGDYRLIPRPDVKLHITGQRRAKDTNIRQAIIDRYGPGKDRAVGRKASPGPLYGITGDCWSALAVAITAAEEPISAPRGIPSIAMVK